MPNALHVADTVLASWQDYSHPETRLNLDTGIEQTVKKPIVDMDLIIVKLGVSDPTARNAAKQVNWNLKEKNVQPVVVKEYQVPRKEVADRRASQEKYGWWKPGPQTVPLEEIPE